MELRAKGVSKTYRRRAVVDDVSFQLPLGITGLLGQNGAGKSTLLKILATVLPASAGQVHYGSLDGRGALTEIRRRLGYLPQQFGLYDHQTGREFLAYACALKGVTPWRVAQAEATRLMEEVGLNPQSRTRLGQYSGGMRQRIGLAQSLINHPDLLILDEPSRGLDPEERIRILNLVSMVSGHGRILLSTHLVTDLEQLATHILVMHHGKLLAQGSPQDIAARAESRVYVTTMERTVWPRLAPAWTARQREPGAPLVVNVQVRADRVVVRVLADTIPESDDMDVAAAPPTLSDGYLALTGLRTIEAPP